MLIDHVVITVKAGDGGRGASTFMRNARTAKGGPDGGNGGNGGSIYVQGSPNVSDLREFQFKKKIIAENGTPGQSSNKYGYNAADLTILLPLGTTITDQNSGEEFEVTDENFRLCIAMGGHGGRGNATYKNSINQSPTHAQPGRPGEARTLDLTLKLIAEIGLIGQPNAGKSSLLAALTSAKPRIGAYPFTTIEPMLGMLKTHAIADIPGLIEGASKGKGLGTKFLQHIEKTKLLIHVIDVSGENPLSAYELVRREFSTYSQKLMEKPEMILLNKTDLVTPEALKKMITIFKKTGRDVLTCSTYDPKSMESLKKKCLNYLEKHTSKTA